MSPPKDFTTIEITLYLALKASGDNHAAAVDTVMGERLLARIFKIS